MHADRAFINKDLPKLAALLHYRILDVSSIKELTARWYPELQRPRKEDSAHRALSDIQHSISGQSSLVRLAPSSPVDVPLTEIALQSSATTARTCSRLRSRISQQQQCTPVVFLERDRNSASVGSLLAQSLLCVKPRCRVNRLAKRRRMH